MTEEGLSFEKVRQLVADETTNPLAERMVAEMSFSSKMEKVSRELHLTDEFRQILLMENGFPMQDWLDLTPELERLKIANTVIDRESLLPLAVSLRAIFSLCRFLQNGDEDKYPFLRALSGKVDLDDSILRRLGKIVDDEGNIPDNASAALLEIRRHIQMKKSQVDAQINRTLSYAKREGWAPQGAEVTIRNGRMVIPMLDTHRRKIKGLIHDESATRQTAYLEPSEVVELNNDLRELEFDERHEIIKILTEFTESIRPSLADLKEAYWFLARMDFIRAKARFAIKINAAMPVLTERPCIHLLSARHPLLLLKFKELYGEGKNVVNWRRKYDKGVENAPSGETETKEVVPFDLSLDNDRHILVVSGPNAGGKSVCLKAVGLIQYMLQCGLLVPCRETSELGLFDRVCVDIGDSQSLENDLSTYSSHLRNMKTLLDVADARTLFLLDELGSGTEPRSGCAIAEALLEELHRRHSFGVVTTHFSDLKLLADKYEGIVNGAMLFDTDRMLPLYRLSVGHPGSSFAFEIAARTGLPADVLSSAREKVGSGMLDFEQQLQQLQLDKEEVARQRTELQVSDNFLNEVVTKYQALTRELEGRKHEILSNARSQAIQIIADANKTVERTISDIKSANAEKAATRAARERMQHAVEQLQSEETAQQQESEASPHRPAAKENHRKNTAARQQETLDPTPPKAGDIVRTLDGESYGRLVETKGSKAVVETGSIRITLPLDTLVRTGKKEIPEDRSQRQNNRFQSIFDDINEKRKSFSTTLDLRGQRAEEALTELRHFLDDAQLLREKELRILHGKGYGILKTVIRQQLQSEPEVESFHSEAVELGGDGITIVHMR